MKGDHTDHKIKTEPRRHTLTKIQDNLEKREPWEITNLS